MNNIHMTSERKQAIRSWLQTFDHARLPITDAMLRDSIDEIERLESIIAAAPHAVFCHSIHGIHECDCWKAIKLF